MAAAVAPGVDESAGSGLGESLVTGGDELAASSVVVDTADGADAVEAPPVLSAAPAGAVRMGHTHAPGP